MQFVQSVWAGSTSFFTRIKYKASYYCNWSYLQPFPLANNLHARDVSRMYKRVEMAGTTLGVASRRGTHGRASRARVRVPTCRRRRGSVSAHTYIPVVCRRSVTFLTRADSTPIFALLAAVSGRDRPTTDNLETLCKQSTASRNDTISRSRAFALSSFFYSR